MFQQPGQALGQNQETDIQIIDPYQPSDFHLQGIIPPVTHSRKPVKPQSKLKPEVKIDYDLEYAKLIAKQFPIHDKNGHMIDYSNINEYQLELLALHEDYGEEKDPEKKKQIFLKLAGMSEEDFLKQKKKLDPRSHIELSTSASTANDQRTRAKKKTFGQNIISNPDYKKNVIQLEKERIEKERQELMMKRKRNSNYIQQCIRHGNEQYSEKLNSLMWLKKDHSKDHSDVDTNFMSKIDEKNMEILKKKQEIIAKYNKMSKENNPAATDDGCYRFNMIRGNNSALVQRVLESRDYWVELEEKHLTIFSFKWSPVSRGIRFDQLGVHGQKKLVNHLERHDLLTTKDQLYVSMHKYCEQAKLNVFQYLPIQFILDLSAKNFINEVDRFCQYFNQIEKVKTTNEPLDQHLTFINHNILQNKTIQLESKYKNLVSRKFTLDPSMYSGGNVWLIKPNDFNRGRGVRLFNTLEQLRKLMKEFSLGNEMDFYMHNACYQILANEKQLGAQLQARDRMQNKQKHHQQPQLLEEEESKQKPQDEPGPNLTANVKSEVFVIQKYIEKPLLIDGRKFDIRLWVLVNMIDLRDQRCYLFSEGYIRTSSHKFSLEEIDQPFIHLTNNAVQQFDSNYGKLEEGNQLSFSQAREIILKETGQDIDFYQILREKIEPVIELTFKSVENGKLNPHSRKHMFEIFGYDFMIDQSLQPWLIEINTNPCLEETSKLLKSLLPRMIDDAFKLTVDVMFPPPQRDEPTPQKQSFPVAPHPDSDNLWRHIYTLKP